MDLHKYDRIALDSETTGLQIYGPDRAFGISLSTPDGNDHYIDMRTDTYVNINDHGSVSAVYIPGITSKVKQQLATYKGKMIFHNESFDHRALHKEGFTWPFAATYDTCIAACLINEHEHAFTLDLLGRKYTQYRKQGAELWARLAALWRQGH